MRRVPSTEAKARFAEVLRTAEGGERIAISRNGRVVAYLVPAEEAEQQACREGVARFRAAAAGWKPSGMSVREILAARNEGRRF